MSRINRYRKLIVALVGALGAIYGPDAANGAIALLTALGVWAVPNEA